MALTVGRGGSFVDKGGDRLRYVASGQEPTVRLFSRSGFPVLRQGGGNGRRERRVRGRRLHEGSDRRDPGRPGSAAAPGGLSGTVLPLILAEMQIRYYSQSAFLATGQETANDVRQWLGRGLA